MFNRFLFCKNGGGQVLFLLSFLLAAFDSNAQLPIRTAVCDQLKVLLVPKAFDGDNDQDPCTNCCYSEYSCERMEYVVYLQAIPGVNLPSGGNFNLSYDELYLVLKLNRVTATISSINQMLTESEDCINYNFTYPDTFPLGSLKVNLNEDEITLKISEDEGDPTTNIEFTGYVSTYPLFSIVVDAFPGEEFGIDCVDFTYVSGNNQCIDQCDGASSGSEEFPMPGATNTSLTLSLGDINCDQEEYIDLPILVSSALSGTLYSLDFAIIISNDAPDGFYAAPEVISTLSGTSPDILVPPMPNSAGEYIVTFRYTGLMASTIVGTDNELAVLRIYRPPYLCQGYTITAALQAGRIRTLGGGSTPVVVCESVQLGMPTTAACVVDEVDICADFIINTTTEDELADCSELKAYVTLSWDAGVYGSSLQFDLLRVMLEFEMDNGVTIVDAQPEGFTCPSSGNDPITCSSGCLGFTDNTVELCINVGSPITVANNARIVITFDAPIGCVQHALVRKMVLKRHNESVCQPDVNPPVGFPYCSPVLEHFIQGDIATELACWIQEVELNIVATDDMSGCDKMLLTGTTDNTFCAPYNSGCLCSISLSDGYTVTPLKNDNPLNGVTTYDLVLISKHILGIEPFSTPYEMIAADANKSGSITTFDNVEFRKLILGIYNDLPNNTSWRFVDKAFVFPNPSNPFQTYIPEIITVSSLPDLAVDFVGVKVGDVNNTAVTECTVGADECHAFERPAGLYSLKVSQRNVLKAGDYCTIPVRADGTMPLIAWQSAFRFDPSLLELVGPSLGDAPDLSLDNFNLAQAKEGIIRALWYAQPDAWEEEALKPGQSLFNLTFKVKQDLPENTQLLHTDDSLMPNFGWSQAGTSYSLQTESSNLREGDIKPDMPVWVRCHPNPSPGEVVFDVLALPQPQRAQLRVFDAFGRRMWQLDLKKENGPMQLAVPEAAQWPSGVYHWELRFDKQTSVGTFVRQ